MSHSAQRQVFLAIDVSTSVKKFFGQICCEIERSLSPIRHTGEFDLTTYLFHRRVMPFPCERFRGPHGGETAVLPTTEDLKNRVGRGTAALDALFQMLVDAGHCSAPRKQVLLLTDGGEHSSHRHPFEVRRKVDVLRSETDVTLVGFSLRSTPPILVNLAKQLGLVLAQRERYERVREHAQVATNVTRFVTRSVECIEVPRVQNLQ